MWYVELKICMRDKQHRYYKHTKFRQNLRGSLRFFGDWAYTMATLDSPNIYVHTPGLHISGKSLIAMVYVTANCCIRVAI